MDIKTGYNHWADQYDAQVNRTRDLEKIALQHTLSSLTFDRCLEVGCGTGKNTEWLIGVSKELVCIDISIEMLTKAKAKIQSPNVRFEEVDIQKEWKFTDLSFDLISFSLVLEHIENLVPIFQNAYTFLNPGGYVYIGELHPYKQYSGIKARFETGEGLTILPCFNHHVSDFIKPAKSLGFSIVDVHEFFDEGDRSGIPRILAILLRKN